MGNIIDRSTVLDRVKEYYQLKGNADLARFLGVAPNTVTNWYSRNSFDLDVLYTKCVGLDLNWLLTGQGEMLKSDREEKPDIKFYDPGNKPAEKKLIPFYEDIATVGGVNAVSADVDSTSGVSEWIDAGDWFRDATAAIRHYGDSMVEYPSGCILALKKVEDIRLLLWGKNYCIETTEYRITKQLQPGEDKNTLLAYSSNRETYHDGRLIHAPVPIPLDTIRSIFLVLGCVIKEYSSGAVYIKK